MSSGGGFSSFLANVGRTVLQNAMNSTNSTSGMQMSRSFFDLGNDSADGGQENVVELSGRGANSEIAEIYPIHSRVGGLILHGPRKDIGNQSPGLYTLYNIILHSTNANSSSEKMYSIFRSDSETEALRMFVIYKLIFPDLIKASQISLDLKTLERITKLAKKHEAYTAPHIAAALDMVDQLKSPVLRETLTEQESNGLLTPLHVACVHAKLEAFKVIADDDRVFNRVYDYEDLKGNNIIHLAANCSDKAVGAAIIKIVKEKLFTNRRPGQGSSSRSLFQLFMKVNNEGNAPIHLACINSNIEATQLLVDLMDFSVVHNHGNSNNDNVTLPLEELMPTEGMPGSERETLLNLRTVATGCTPLHLAVTNTPLLSQLLTSGFDPNVADNDGLSPLHKAVLASNLASTLQLLANSAYSNLAATTGIYVDATPLHMAASICAIDCIKALIVFGADLDMKDGNGHTARHLVASVFSGNGELKQEALFVLAAAGAKRCTLSLLGGGHNCAEGCKPGGKNDGKKPDSWKIKKDGTSSPALDTEHGLLVHEHMRGLSIMKESYMSANDDRDGGEQGPVVGGRLLSLDGGGIRGLVLTQMLFFIEKEFGSLAGREGAPIISYFDWVAGTSTGGILALALACGKSVLETQGLYMKLKDKVFTGDRPYSAKRMEEFLKKEFGSETKMNSIRKPNVMIMTALANRSPPDLYIFRNYISPRSLLGEPEEFAQSPEKTYVWETAKVTGAAPSYFTLDHEKFIDGGLISNNPTLDALSELVQFKAVMMGTEHSASGRADNKWKLPSVVVSLGTGIPPKVDSAPTNLDIGWPTGVIDAISKVPRLTHLINLLVDQATQSEGQVVERARAWCASTGVPYFRFSPEMSSDIGLDEKKDEVLINLMWETWCYMVGHRNIIKETYERLRDADIYRMDPRRAERMDVSSS